MISSTGKSTSPNDFTTEKIGTEQRDMSEKTVQIGSECLDREQSVLGTVVTDSAIDEKSNHVSMNMTENSVIQLPGEMRDAVTTLVEEQPQPVPVQVKSNSVNELLDPPSGDVAKNISSQNEPGETSDAVTGLVEDQTQSVPAQVKTESSGDAAKNNSSDCSERKSKNLGQMRVKHGAIKNSKLSKKYVLRSLGSSDRALRSRTKDNKPKDPEPIDTVTDVNNDEMKTKERRKKKKKKKTRKEGINDQFSKIRAQLRYYLNRISYEQNLIDAYSGEGWKGYSMEKLKPEKEIQRAKSEILRRKLKIRDLFQNLDSLCAEGRLPESLFDSEGEIDSEDIFCAKCQTKVLATNNDIILCDGACDRGYHQLCLDPPLLTEDIPPGDEGWLCPGCDCKDDCIELVNDLLGTSLSLTDSWERVFPEAATAAGSILDHNLGLPSDDSDDDDYNPDAPEDAKVEGGKSSSDESEYASASEKFEDPGHEDQYMGLPSEDSEDDDFDPDAPNPGAKDTEESSSSDFTSDSEDLAATIKDNMSTGQDDVTSAPLDDVKNFKGSSKQNRKKPSITDELSSLAEPDLGEEDLTPVSGKRNVERLDYQKLYEETYHSDTSDDEDWADTATPSRKKKLTAKITPGSPNGNASNNSRRTAKRNTHQHKVENTNNSPTKTLEGCTESGKKRGSSYNKLGEAVVQRLHKSFKENQYPERTAKESLAQELGLTFQQVDKWFGNSRWRFRHSSCKEASPGSNASQQANDSGAENKGDNASQQASESGAENKGDRGNASQQATDSGGENKGETEHQLVSQETSGEKSKTPSSKKRKRLSEPQTSEAGLVHNGSIFDCLPVAGTSNKMKKKKGK